MNLIKLLEGIEYTCEGNLNIDIDGLYHNSKKVKNNGVFFALNGLNASGEDYALEAVRNGARVVVSENKLNLPQDVTNIIVEDVRAAMSKLASNYYDNPCEKMIIIGVTGTNGKTTSTYMLKSIFETAGKKVGVVGTNGIVVGEEKIDVGFTTPDPILLQKHLSNMAEKGVDVVCMEVSAHALELQKLWGVLSDIALFTNLTQDHLDYFKTMDNYKRAKAKYFTKEMSKFAVINIDDNFGFELFNNIEIPVLTYSKNERNEYISSFADIIAIDNKHNVDSQTFTVQTMKGTQKIKLNISGAFNVSNALGAIAASIMCGIDLKTIAKGLGKLEKVDGRFNTYDINGIRVIIDYAHTPDGLENILKATKEITEGRVYSVFGCGGNRDSFKRPIMGSISERNADFTILTSDNPRFERPEDIVKDIQAGMEKGNYVSILDRKKAIEYAIGLADKGDSVVIAGKGSEPYIDMLGVKTPYEDRKVVEDIINMLSNENK